jgi:hypothetical protein
MMGVFAIQNKVFGRASRRGAESAEKILGEEVHAETLRARRNAEKRFGGRGSRGDVEGRVCLVKILLGYRLEG